MLIIATEILTEFLFFLKGDGYERPGLLKDILTPLLSRDHGDLNI
jgi:hypothetical protein